jgi:hypothetical protein
MKIALATDAWHPQISGVVTTLIFTNAFGSVMEKRR